MTPYRLMEHMIRHLVTSWSTGEHPSNASDAVDSPSYIGDENTNDLRIPRSP